MSKPTTYDEYTLYDIMVKLNNKAEELYALGVISVQMKNAVNKMKKYLDDCDFEVISAYCDYMKAIRTDDNYEDIIDEIGDKCFVLQKSGSSEPDVSTVKQGDIITDGELTVQCVPYDIPDSKGNYEHMNTPYAERENNKYYAINDIYNIGTKSFKVISTLEE